MDVQVRNIERVVVQYESVRDASTGVRLALDEHIPPYDIDLLEQSEGRRLEVPLVLRVESLPGAMLGGLVGAVVGGALVQAAAWGWLPLELTTTASAMAVASVAAGLGGVIGTLGGLSHYRIALKPRGSADSEATLAITAAADVAGRLRERLERAPVGTVVA